jgi:hypothetical protein
MSHQRDNLAQKIASEATAKEATRLMLEHKLGCSPVVEGHTSLASDGDGHHALCRELLWDRTIAPVGGRVAISFGMGDDRGGGPIQAYEGHAGGAGTARA